MTLQNKEHLTHFDISSKAIERCKSKFEELELSKKTYSFYRSCDEKHINDFLIENKINNFDLVVFDRVLYCLKENELIDQLGILTKYAKFILIDDFQLDNDIKYCSLYKHRNWISIMNALNFTCESNISTMHSTVNEINERLIDDANPRTLVFKNLKPNTLPNTT